MKSLRSHYVRAWFGLLFGCIPALADSDLELVFEGRSIQPTLINEISRIDPTLPNWKSVELNEQFQRVYDGLIRIPLYKKSEKWDWGLYGRYSLPSSVEASAVPLDATVAVLKETKLSGFAAGAFGRWFPLGREKQGIFLELGLGGGQSSLTQTIQGNGTSGLLTARALQSEVYFLLGSQIRLSAYVNLQIHAGYVRSQAGYYSIDSVTGSLYGGLRTGDRLAVTRGSADPVDLRLNRSGPMVQIGFSFDFNPEDLFDQTYAYY
jgi:hypothetical protein